MASTAPDAPMTSLEHGQQHQQQPPKGLHEEQAHDHGSEQPQGARHISPLPKPSSPPPALGASAATTALADATATASEATTPTPSQTTPTPSSPCPARDNPPPTTATATTTTPPRSPRTSSSISSPPYWHSTTTSPVSGPAARQQSTTASTSTLHPHHTASHTRAPSADSASLLHALGAITLRDNEADDAPRSDACWARAVSVVDYVIIDGTRLPLGPLSALRPATSAGHGGASASSSSSSSNQPFIRLPGAFVSWTIRVETLSGSAMTVSKRYSEFDRFRARLIRSFPASQAAVPELPPKSVIAKFRPRFLEKRRAGLQYFLNCVILNPEFAGSPVLKEFLFN